MVCLATNYCTLKLGPTTLVAICQLQVDNWHDFRTFKHPREWKGEKALYGVYSHQSLRGHYMLNVAKGPSQGSSIPTAPQPFS